MPTEQSTLTGGSMAEQLAQNQQSISIAEFVEKNKQMLGFDSKSRAIVTAVKEAVDNSLDATEESGILPEISVKIEESNDYYKIIIEDNGPGITESQISKIFGKLLYGSRFNSRTQSRGQQGIGISAAVLYSHKTSGKPATIRSKTKDKNEAVQMEVMIDTDTNEPIVENKKKISWDDKNHGTRIELEMDANMRGRKQLHQYMRDTALVNPHATIRLSEPKWEFESERVTEELPPETEEIKPHPHGIELGTLQEMINATTETDVESFLEEDFSKVGRKTSTNILNKFKDYYFGKELAWSPKIIFSEEEFVLEELIEDTNTDEEDDISNKKTTKEQFKDQIKSVVHRKGPEATEEFASCIYEQLKESDEITHSFVHSTVIECAENIEQSYDKRIGDTVREKTTDSVWSYIQDNRVKQIYNIIDEATSTRKSEKAIQLLSQSLNKLLKRNYPIESLSGDEFMVVLNNASDYVTEETGTSIGDTARENIFNEFWSEISRRSPKDVLSLPEIREDRDAIEALLNAMKDTKVNAPSKKCLSPIKTDNIEEGLRNSVEADFYTSTKRDGEVYKGSPFIVEAGIAYGGEIEGADDMIDLRRFANRVPLVYQQGACAITQVTESINWRNYNLKQAGGGGSLPRGPMVLLVHIASTNVPFTSESKDAVASAEIIETEIERAVRSVARDLKKHLKKQKSLKKRRKKRDTIGDILPPLTESLSNVVETQEEIDSSKSIARIMNNLYIDYDENELTFNSFLSKNTSLEVENEQETIGVEINSGGKKIVDVSGDFKIKNIESEKVTFSEKLEDAEESILEE